MVNYYAGAFRLLVAMFSVAIVVLPWLRRSGVALRKRRRFPSLYLIKDIENKAIEKIKNR